MRRRNAARLALAGALLISPSCALPQAVDGGSFFAKNNSQQTLRCRHRVDQGKWERYFRLRPGAEFLLRSRPGMQTVYLFCDPPVKRVSYALALGKRYSILRGEGGVLELREITVGSPGEGG